MSYTINRAKKAILNKWDWENPINNIPIFLWGSIGIGKSSIVQQIVIERMIFELEKLNDPNNKDLLKLKNYKSLKEVENLLDQHLLSIRLAERAQEFITGIPAPNFADKSATFLMPDSIVKFSKQDWVVLFIDELDKAEESKFCAITHLIESRRIGDFSLPIDTMVIIAANRVADSYISKPIPPELRNRASHIQVQADVPAWVAWAEENGIRKEIPRFLQYKYASGQNYLAVYDDQAESDTTSGFPTPRTWHYAAVQMDRLEAIGASYTEFIEELAEFVGSKAAIDFKIYCDLYSKINIMDILTGVKKIMRIAQQSSANKAALSEQYILVFAMMDQLKPDMLNSPNYINNFLMAIEDLLPDLRAILMRFVFSNDLLIEKICSVDRGNKLISSYLDKMSKIIK